MNPDQLTSLYREKKFSRRTLLKLGGVAGVGLLGAGQVNPQEEATNKDTAVQVKDEEVFPIPPEEQQWSEQDISSAVLQIGTALIVLQTNWEDTRNGSSTRSSYENTVILSALEMIGSMLLSIMIIKYTEQKIGNSGATELNKAFEEDSARMFIISTFVAPVLEESFFRILPSRLLDATDQEGMQWKYGIPAAVLFSLAHNLGNEDYKGGFSTEYIPLPQFLGGVFHWYIARTYGEGQAIVSHAQHNGMASAILLAAQQFK